MNSFLYQVEKVELEENIKLNFYYVNENQNIQVKTHTINYFLLVDKVAFETLDLKENKAWKIVKKLKGPENEDSIKIEFTSKEMYSYILSLLKEKNIKHFETDLSSEHSFIIDNNIEFSSEKDSKKISKYFKTLYLDIETLGKDTNTRIALLSIYSPHNLKENCVFVNTQELAKKHLQTLKKEKYKDFKVVFCENERELLLQFQNLVLQEQPQLILGWNVIGFDFKVIRDKMKAHSLDFTLTKFEGDVKMRIASEYFGKHSLQFPGCLVLDGIDLLKTNFLIFNDYKLDTVAKEVLKDSKISLGEEDIVELEDKIKAIETLFEKNPKKLIEYNFKDSELVYKIVEKLSLISLMISRSLITSTPIAKVNSPIASLDILYLKELHKQNRVAKSNYNFNQSNSIVGAYVISPEKGFYSDIIVLDFKSLYPSIITTFNIDPFTIVSKSPIKSPNGLYFSEKKGILPSLIETLSFERDKAKKAQDKVKSHALKITMNSFYGAMASPKSRFYNHNLGEAITSFGRFLIQKTKTFIEEQGDLVIYGDTDSIFVKSKNKFNSEKEKIEYSKYLEKLINNYFKKWIYKEYKRESFLTIEAEKIFSSFFIASKKRYVGFDIFKKRLQFTGMEAVRGDWTQLAKEFQVQLIKYIFKGNSKEEIIKFIKEYVSKLKKGKFDSLLIYRKKITKPLKSYTKTTPPHVKAARELKSFQGKIVDYVMVKEGPRHVSLFDPSKIGYDYSHYIEKQLKGVSDDILESLDLDFDTIIGTGKNTKLSKFF